MPRHSPCALISLTFVRRNFISSPSAQARSSLHSAFSSSQNRASTILFFRKKRILFHFFDVSGSQNYAGFRRNLPPFVSIVVYPIISTFDCYFCDFTVAPSVALLVNSSFLCSVFKVQTQRLHFRVPSKLNNVRKT